MKRTTMLFAAMAALTLASCTKNEVNDGSIQTNDLTKISFNSSTGTTRAIANGLDEVKGGFTVRGFDQAGTAFISGNEATSTYRYAADRWSWVDEVGKDWPEASSFPLTFYAEYPKVDMSNNVDLKYPVTMDLDMATQKDVLIAKEVVNTRPPTGFSPLNFKHIFSNLMFKIETRENYKVTIQSIRVVNTAKNSRMFLYESMAYQPIEPPYTTDNLAMTDGTYNPAQGFFYSNAKFEFEGAADAKVATVPATNGIMMQMPQLAIDYWTAANTTNGLGAFQKDALAWKEGTDLAGATKLATWFANEPATADQPGMKNSRGWEGARIEVIYRIYDVVANKSYIGRQIGEAFSNNGIGETADKDYFVRVGYPLDLSAIKVADVSKGWEMNKRYTYTIQLGTAGATNGVLLDPGYVKEDGTSPVPAVGVDNPATVTPGNPVTPGIINFNVSVSDWIDNNSGTEIL